MHFTRYCDVLNLLKRLSVLHCSNYVLNVSIVIVVHCFQALQEALASAPVKIRASEAGPSKAESSPKESLSPKTETDSTSGDMSCSSWVVDSSGFLSPNGPALKEVLDLVDGVSVLGNQHMAYNLNLRNHVCPQPLDKMSFSIRTLKVGAT